MRNFVFEIQEVIDKQSNLDIWVVYNSDSDLDKCYSLYTLLWDIHFDPSKVVKNYEIQHEWFYKILSGENGKANLALIIDSICDVLKMIADIGAMYGNLRVENLIIKMDNAKSTIK